MSEKQVITIAIIGSFKQHYDHVLKVLKQVKELGIEVTSPTGHQIIEEGIPFVRFTSDNADWEDDMVQTVALHRILRADMVYVVAPDGYVGRTTCYEIGRIVQSSRPLYFSEAPQDLPLAVPASHVIAPEALVDKLSRQDLNPAPLTSAGDSLQVRLERMLILGHYKNEGEWNEG